MPYPTTGRHKKAAVENIQRIAPQLGTRLINEPGYGWQVEVFNPKTHKTQQFDAYLVGENFLKRPEFADYQMLDELVYYGLLTRKVVEKPVTYE